MNDDRDTLIYILEQADIPIAEMYMWHGINALSPEDQDRLCNTLALSDTKEIQWIHKLLKKKIDLLQHGGNTYEYAALLEKEQDFFRAI